MERFSPCSPRVTQLLALTAAALCLACADTKKKKGSAANSIKVCENARDPIAYCEKKHGPTGLGAAQWYCTNRLCPSLDFRDTGCYSGEEVQKAELLPSKLRCLLVEGPVVPLPGKSGAGTGTDTGNNGSTSGSDGANNSSNPDDKGGDNKPNPKSCSNDAQCSDPAAPICDPKSKSCVACYENKHCPSTKPLCDRSGAIPACVGCTELWGQCPNNAACQIIPGQADSGHCFANVKYIDKSASCVDGDGSPSSPYCDLKGLAKDANTPTTAIVLSGERFAETLNVLPGQRLALRSMSGNTELTGNRVGANITVADRGALLLDGFRVTGSTTSGIDIRGDSALYLSKSKVSDHGQDGIAVLDGRAVVHTRDSVVAQNAGWGLRFAGKRLSMVNTMMARNGREGSASGGGILLGNDSDLELLYTTSGANPSTDLNPNLRCAPGTRVNIRNSLLWGDIQKAVQECNRIELQHSAHNINALEALGANNRMLVEGLFEIETWMVDPAVGDLRLRSPKQLPGVAKIADVALRIGGDPAKDFEGEDRPSIGATDWPGADRAAN